MNVFGVLAACVLLLHLVWIGWVILGWTVTRNRPVLQWFHIGALSYGIAIQIGPWPCPLTLVEQWLQTKAGRTSYRASFLIHYLELLVYPNVSETLLTWLGSGVCLFILGIYGVRFLKRTKDGKQ